MNKSSGTGHFKLTSEQIREASQLFDTVKLHALAKRYNVTHRGLVKAMRREGLLRPKKRVADSVQLPPEKLALALKLHLEDVSLEKICVAVESSLWVVRRNLMATGQYRTRHEKSMLAIPIQRKSSNGAAASFLRKPLRVPI